MIGGPREQVGKAVEETINFMLGKKTGQLVGARPYERPDERATYDASAP